MLDDIEVKNRKVKFRRRVQKSEKELERNQFKGSIFTANWVENTYAVQYSFQRLVG